MYTDHSACTSLLNCAHPSAKIARWALIVQELDLEIKHRSGKSNANADALSRNPTDRNAHPVLEVTVTTDSVPDELDRTSQLSAQQRQDPELLALIKYLEDGVVPEDENQAQQIVLEHPKFTVSDGVLHYENPQHPGGLKLVVPRQVRQILLEEAHGKKFSGHFAERKLFATLQKKYWWHNM